MKMRKVSFRSLILGAAFVAAMGFGARPRPSPPRPAVPARSTKAAMRVGMQERMPRIRR